MKKFLFINPFGIGDVLFTTPLIIAIKDNYPDSFIGYWCNERVQAIFKSDPHINKLFALSRGDIKRIYNISKSEGIKKTLDLFLGIKKEHFDIALDFSLDHRYGLFSILAGIKKRIGYNYKNRGRFLTDKIDIDGYEDKHIVEYYLDLLKFIDIIPKTRNLYLFISESAKSKVKTLFKRIGIAEKDLLVGIAPGAGASWGKDASLKHWSSIRFTRLSDMITEGFGAKILILGDESERPLADILANETRYRPIDLVGKTTLEEFIAIIDSLDLLITNDGGPLHIAVALGVKTISIFGPVDEVVYGPYPISDKHIVIKKDIPCRPCYEKFRMPFCNRNRECINSINIGEVFEAVKKQLEGVS